MFHASLDLHLSERVLTIPDLSSLGHAWDAGPILWAQPVGDFTKDTPAIRICIKVYEVHATGRYDSGLGNRYALFYQFPLLILHFGTGYPEGHMRQFLASHIQKVLINTESLIVRLYQFHLRRAGMGERDADGRRRCGPATIHEVGRRERPLDEKGTDGEGLRPVGQRLVHVPNDKGDLTDGAELLAHAKLLLF